MGYREGEETDRLTDGQTETETELPASVYVQIFEILLPFHFVKPKNRLNSTIHFRKMSYFVQSHLHVHFHRVNLHEIKVENVNNPMIPYKCPARE